MRNKLFQIPVTDDEQEYINRRAFQDGTSGSALCRTRILPINWKQELGRLRKIQPVEIQKAGRKPAELARV